MRSNSGKDESRNNLGDPTLRDQRKKRKNTTPSARQKTTEMGSQSRKSGQRGAIDENGEG